MVRDRDETGKSSAEFVCFWVRHSKQTTESSIAQGGSMNVVIQKESLQHFKLESARGLNTGTSLETQAQLEANSDRAGVEGEATATTSAEE